MRDTAGRKKHDSRRGRESLSKRLGRKAKQIKARDRHACVYCGATAKSSGLPLHLDHVMPKSEGGQDDPDNLVLACHHCNCTRKAMSLSQWARYVSVLAGVTPRTVVRRVRRQLAKPLPEIGRKAA